MWNNWKYRWKKEKNVFSSQPVRKCRSVKLFNSCARYRATVIQEWSSTSAEHDSKPNEQHWRNYRPHVYRNWHHNCPTTIRSWTNISSIDIRASSPRFSTTIERADYTIRRTSVDLCSKMNCPTGEFSVKKSSPVAGKEKREDFSHLGDQFRMTYTKHRSTQETLQVLDSLGLDTVRSTTDDIIKKFGWENDCDLTTKGRLSARKRLRTIIWQLFEEPHSSRTSKVRRNDLNETIEREIDPLADCDHFDGFHSSFDRNVRSAHVVNFSNHRLRADSGHLRG